MLRHLVPIETSRLCLRPFTFEDEEAVLEWNSDPDVKKYTGGLRNRDGSLFDLVRWMQRFRTKGWGPLAVTEKGGLHPIGWCGLQPLPHTCDFELLYGYAKHVWGQGYATEAGRALLRAGFAALHIERIVARVHTENVTSQRVVTKLGMRNVHQVFNDIYGGMVDLFVVEKVRFQEVAPPSM